MYVLEVVFGLLQRALDYCGSVWAFFFGFKEVICIKISLILSLQRKVSPQVLPNILIKISTKVKRVLELNWFRNQQR